MSRDPTMNIDYSLFDTMQTEELEEILYQDSLLPEGERADPDLIWYIMEVLVSRQEKEGHIDDVDAAWKSFERNYLPFANDPTPLYGDDDDSNSVEENTEGVTQSRSRKKKSLRTVWIAAAIIGILVLGSFSAYALGYDLWGVVASWTKETFGFSSLADRSLKEVPEVLWTLRDALTENNASGIILPSYFPEGYELSKAHIYEKAQHTEYVYSYTKDESFISIRINYYFSDESHGIYEKDSEEPVVYHHNGMVFYIIKNNGVYTAVWYIGNAECSIMGIDDYEEMTKILDSF